MVMINETTITDDLLIAIVLQGYEDLKTMARQYERFLKLEKLPKSVRYMGYFIPSSNKQYLIDTAKAFTISELKKMKYCVDITSVVCNPCYIWTRLLYEISIKYPLFYNEFKKYLVDLLAYARGLK